MRREHLYDVMRDFTWTSEINQDTAAAGCRTFLMHTGAIKSYIDTQGLNPSLQDDMAMTVWAFAWSGCVGFAQRSHHQAHARALKYAGAIWDECHA
ncbi:MAG: hypothetical protein LRY56_09845 [Burkholderiaceae bacterium]|nr:hypothetical protein [Burkholderiaceae bacterium]